MVNGELAYVSGADEKVGRLQELLSGRLRFAAEQDHIWWGVSVEDRTYGLPRISDLQKAPARVRFLSIEPLLEDLGAFDLTGISWAIVGGESGPGARPMREEWVVSVRDQCSGSQRAVFLQAVGRSEEGKNGRLLEAGRTTNILSERLTIPGRPVVSLCSGHSEFVSKIIPASALVQASV